MITNLSKRLAYACLLSAQLLTYSTAFAKSGGGAIAGGGGDATEERVNEIRTDLLKWINKDGAKDLILPSSLSYGEYFSKMTRILKPKEVIIGFVEKDDPKNEELQVNVNGMPKTCRGFISKETSKYHILCNILRFQNTSDSEQYKLIHHEYAGLVNVENNEEAASDYAISSQITEYLSMQTVLRLAVKTKRDEQVGPPEMVITKNKYIGNNVFEVEYTLKNAENVLQVTLQKKTPNFCLSSQFPKTVLRDAPFIFKAKIEAVKQNHMCEKNIEFDSVIVQYTDGSVDMIKPLEYTAPDTNFYLPAIENRASNIDLLKDVVKFKQLNEEIVVDKSDKKYKLKNFKMNYEITMDTEALDLTQYRGVIILAQDFQQYGSTDKVEIISEDPQELAKFIKAQKRNLSFTYVQTTKITKFGCFELTDEIGSCLYEKQSPVDVYYNDKNISLVIALIPKDEVSDFKFAKLTLPKAH